MRRIHILGAAVLLVGIGVAAWWLFPSDERKIRALLVQLCDATSVAAGEDAIARMARAARLGPLLTETATVEIEEGTPVLTGRDAIVGTVANMAALTGGLEVEALDPKIEIEPDAAAASARTTVRVTELGATGDAAASEHWLAELRFQKVEGAWLLDRVRGVRRPGGPPPE